MMKYLFEIMSIVTLFVIMSASLGRCKPLSNHHVSMKRIKNSIRNQVLNKLKLEKEPEVMVSNVTTPELRRKLQEYQRSLQELRGVHRSLFTPTAQESQQFNTFSLRLGELREFRLSLMYLT